jgi:hypothetical protein
MVPLGAEVATMKDALQDPLDAHEPGETSHDLADATTILENLIELDQLLDEGSRRALGALPYLELSKCLKIRIARERESS